MGRRDVRREVLKALVEVAPDADPDALDPALAFRDQIEIDSLDFLNLVLKLEERLGVHVPEADYPKLSSLDGCVGYLQAAPRGTSAAAGAAAVSRSKGGPRRGRARR